MHKTLLKHKDEIIAFVNKEIAEAITKEDLEELSEALECMCCVAEIVHMDHEIKMDHHEMMMDKHEKAMLSGGNPVHMGHTGNPTSAVSHPASVRDMSTIDGPHTHGIASFTLGNM